jgi:hypothetical protein
MSQFFFMQGSFESYFAGRTLSANRTHASRYFD